MDKREPQRRTRLTEAEERRYCQLVLETLNAVAELQLSNIAEAVELWQNDRSPFAGIWKGLDERLGRTRKARDTFAYKHFVEKYVAQSKKQWPEKMIEAVCKMGLELARRHQQSLSDEQITQIVHDVTERLRLREYTEYSLKTIQDKIRRLFPKGPKAATRLQQSHRMTPNASMTSRAETSASQDAAPACCSEWEDVCLFWDLAELFE